MTTQPAEAPLPTWVDEVGEEQPIRVRRRRRRFVQGGRNTNPRSATQVDSETDEDMPLVRQAILVTQSLPEVFPMSDDADVEVATVAGHVGGPRRIVLVPLSPGTPRSVQDRTAGSTGSRFIVSESDDHDAQPPSEVSG